MTPKQMKARNEAYHLISIAQRILEEAKLAAYANEAAALRARIEADSKLLNEQERNKRIGLA